MCRDQLRASSIASLRRPDERPAAGVEQTDEPLTRNTCRCLLLIAFDRVLRLTSCRRSVEMHDLPLAADALQYEGTTLAGGFASQLKRHDGVSIELLNEQILRSNGCRWTRGAGRIGVEDRLERSLDCRSALNSSQRSRRGRREEHGGVL